MEQAPRSLPSQGVQAPAGLSGEANDPTAPAPRVGHAFEPFTFVVEQAKVEELCHALRDGDPRYRRGAGRVPVPPTFLNGSIQTFVTGSHPVDLLGISRRRALHAGQSYRYLAQVYVGDELTGRTTLTEVTEKTGRAGRVRYLVLETRFEREGELVAVIGNRVAERLDAGGGA